MPKVIYSGSVPDRSLTVLADGVKVQRLRHVRLSADYLQSLFPSPFCLRIWNPPEETQHLLRRTRELTVSHQGTLLAKGDVTEVYREVVPEGILLSVTFCLGASFWDLYISASLSPGMSAAGAVSTLLAMAGSPFRLLSAPPRNPGCARPQAFCGRLAPIVQSLLLSCGATPYLLPSGIALRPSSSMPRQIVIDMDSISGPWIREEIEV